MHSVLDKVLSHEAKTRILRVVCKHNMEWTGRQLARELEISPTTANKFLKELAGEGVVNIKSAGRSHIYSLNTKSYIVKTIIRPFFEKEKDISNHMIGLIKKAISKTNVKVESLAVFGSIAEKRETSRSDIDLLVIIDNARDKNKIEAGLDKIFVRIAQDFQTVISPYILSKAQFKKKYEMKASIVTEILKHHLLITGKPLDRIII